MMYINGQTIVFAFSVVSALIGFGIIFTKIHKWYLNLQALEEKIEKNQNDTLKERQAIKEELYVHSYALLCIAKSMKAEGFNSTIDIAINSLEKHLSKQAHDID